MKFDIFVSYSRKDFDEVNALRLMLQKELPALRIWFDIDGIESGDEFEEKIISAIDNSSYLLFALSDNSIQSKWTKDEVMYAMNTQKKVIPVLLKGATLKGWFLFRFGRIDCVDSTAPLQMQKFIANIRSWCVADEQQAESAQETKRKKSQNTKAIKSSSDSPASSSAGMTHAPMADAASYPGKTKIAKGKKKDTKPSGKATEELIAEGKRLWAEGDEKQALARLKKAAEGGSDEANVIIGDILISKNSPELRKKAIEYYHKAAKNKYAKAQIKLGELYMAGVVVPLSRPTARQWFIKAASQEGQGEVQYRLGKMYQEGISTSADIDEAIKWYKKAIESAYPDAMYALGKIYDNEESGIGSKEDALELYQKGASLGHAYSICELGNKYYEGKVVARDVRKAMQYYTTASELNNPEAKYRLGCIYYTGADGVSKNFSLTFEYISSAANQEYTDAEFFLGKMYYEGIFVKQNTNDAIKWLTKAAEQGVVSAMTYLADLYTDKKDYISAIDWYLKAIENDSDYARRKFHNLFKSGVAEKICYCCNSAKYATEAANKGYGSLVSWLALQYSVGNYRGEKNRNAFILYLEAAKCGDSDAMKSVADCYKTGLGVKQSTKRAIEWYKKADSHGNLKASFEIAFIYRYGYKSSKPNYTEALYWYKKAYDTKEKGWLYARCIGQIYEEGGYGVEKDIDKAIHWYKISAEKGDSDSARKLERLGIG